MEIQSSAQVRPQSGQDDVKQDHPASMKCQPHAHKLWSPFILQKTAISLFLAVLWSILVTSVALFSLSQTRNGLASVNSNAYYAWTYGPTAVFVLLASFWGQVQYRATQLTPWLLMTRGYVPASESILLDYVSPWNVLSLYKASKRKHFFVVLAISGTLVIKLLTALSTVLFTVRTVEVSNQKPFTVTTHFNNTAFFPNSSWPLIHRDLRPLANALAISDYNVSEALGSNLNQVYQVFYETSLGHLGPNETIVVNDTYRAEVEVLTTNVVCEEASSTLHYLTDNTTAAGYQFYYTLSTQDCAYNNTLHYSSYGDNNWQFGYGIEPCQGVFPDLNNYVGNVTLTWQTPEFTSACQEYPVAQTDIRLWAWVREDANYSSSEPAQKVIAVMCTPTYKTNRGLVTVQRNPTTFQPFSTIDIQEPIAVPALSNITGGQILLATYCKTPAPIGALAKETVIGSDTGAIGQLQNTTLFFQMAEKMTSIYMAQVVKYHLMSPSNDTIQGIVQTPDTRLVIPPLSFGLISGFLSLVMIICAALLFIYIPCRVCSRDPGSIGGLATILSRSGNGSRVLRGTGRNRTSEIRQSLKGYSYRTRIGEDGSFLIDQRHEGNQDGPTVLEEIPDDADGNGARNNEDSQNIDPQEKDHWWQPFSTTATSFSTIILITIAMVIALQVLLHSSQKSLGIADVNDKSDVRYTWRFLPALAMLGIQTFFEQLYAAVRTLHPYHQLRRGNAPKSTIMENQERKIATWSFFDALRKQQWPVVFAVLPALLSPFLPVFVAGLYTPEDTTRAEPAKLTQLSTFQLVYQNPNNTQTTETYESIPLLSIGYTTTAVSGFIMSLNMSYPQWTYEQYAFPSVEAQGISAQTGQNWNRLSLRLPGTYVNMNCTELSVPTQPSAVVQWYDPVSATVDPTKLGLDVIDNCHLLANPVNFTLPTAGKYWADIMEGDYNFPPLVDPTCPTKLFFFGYVREDNTTDITAAKCRPRVEVADLDVVLSLPGYEFDLTFPPSLAPNGTTQVLFDGYMNDTEIPINGTFWAQGMQDIFTDSSVERRLINNSLGAASDLAYLPSSFQAIVFGVDGTPADELLNNSTALIAGIQRVFGIVAGQTINSGGRRDYPTNGSVTRPMLNGTVQDTVRVRLKQSVVSTRILQSILAAMALSAIISVALMPEAGRVVPKNPHTIAATWSLLAGSRMMEEDVIPPGSEWCNDGELESRSIFEGHRFTLGWWDTVDWDDPAEVQRSFRIDMTLDDAGGNSERDEESQVSTDAN